MMQKKIANSSFFFHFSNYLKVVFQVPLGFGKTQFFSKLNYLPIPCMDSNLNVQSPHLLKDDNNCLLPPGNAAQKFLRRTIEVMIRKNKFG
jgi:hypothetical protein